MNQKTTNVISVGNAGKRRFGEKHWIWCVWIGVSDGRASKPPTDPQATGFTKSRTEANREAFAYLRTSGLNRYRRNGWCHDVIDRLKEADKRPCLHRCRVGKDKWYWAIDLRLDEDWEFLEPEFSGYASSPEQARRDAEVAVDGEVCEGSHWMIKMYRQFCNAKRKMNERTTDTTTSQPEYVFHLSYAGQTGRKRISKTTKKRIYVYRKDDDFCSGNWVSYCRSTFILDRQEMETNGYTTGADGVEYFPTAESCLHHYKKLAAPECFVTLCLDADATEKSVRSAYRRLALKTHPDSGGNPEDFKRIHDAYEAALKMFA